MTARQTFWDRRKQAVQAEARREAAARSAAEDAEHQAAQAQKSDAELLQELDLPDPDTLTAGDDFSAFMARSVPARLRSRALRRLWRSNPVLANLDGLVDYAEDYQTMGIGEGALKTAYQVGRGLARQIDGLAAQSDPAAGPAPAPAQVAADADPAEQDRTGTQAPQRAAPDPDTETPQPQTAAPRRRMRFSAAGAES